MCVLCVSCVCPVCVLCVSCVCPVCVLCVSCVCPVCVLCVSCVCPVCVLCVSCVCPVCVLCVSCVCPVCVLCVSCVCPVCVLCVSCVGPVCVKHTGPEWHVSCLARHYFTNARKMLWCCYSGYEIIFFILIQSNNSFMNMLSLQTMKSRIMPNYTELYVSCLARHYFTNARKILWCCAMSASSGFGIGGAYIISTCYIHEFSQIDKRATGLTTSYCIGETGFYLSISLSPSFLIYVCFYLSACLSISLSVSIYRSIYLPLFLALFLIFPSHQSLSASLTKILSNLFSLS